MSVKIDDINTKDFEQLQHQIISEVNKEKGQTKCEHMEIRDDVDLGKVTIKADQGEESSDDDVMEEENKKIEGMIAPDVRI